MIAALVLSALAAAGPKAPPQKPPPARPPAASPAAKPPPPPPKPTTGTVTGLLRHKGCQSLAAGAVIGVVGRDVQATSDHGGRFSLALPPGTYSVVISGPNLVADQRVDGVAVALGQGTDLGMVEVWPEQQPQGCIPPPRPSEDDDEEPRVAIAPDTPFLDLPGSGVSPGAVAPEQIWVRGSVGPGPGQFGLQGNPARDDEDAYGPPTFAVEPRGTLLVLDALNGRAQRFDAKGRFAQSFPAGKPSTWDSDIASSEDGLVFVYTGGETPSLAQHDTAGRLLISGALPPAFKGVDLLVVQKQKPILVMQNGQAARAELGWGGLRADGPLPGLPVADHFARAERIDRHRAAVKLLTADGLVRRSVQVRSAVGITGVRLVGLNRKGELLVAVDRAEGGDTEDPSRAEVLLLAVTPQGQLMGLRSVPPGDRRYEFREFAIAPDGAVVQMQSDADEVRFVRWTLLPPPRDAVAGEGLVRGRVVENGHPCLTASVSIARLKRTVSVSPDGSFEMRLPPGTYVVSFRRPGPSGAEGPSAERKVAVAAGATVDLGPVAMQATPPAPRPDAGVPPAPPPR